MNDRHRIEININSTNPEKCWDWLLSTYNGYPQIRIQKETWKVSRLIYFLHYGVDPKELDILHKCDRPICCNPNHLFLGDAKQMLEIWYKKVDN